MAINKINEAGVQYLRAEIKQSQKEIHALGVENEALHNTNAMLLESLQAITDDESYWSDEAIKSGIVWRLKNVLTQCRQNNG